MPVYPSKMASVVDQLTPSHPNHCNIVSCPDPTLFEEKGLMTIECFLIGLDFNLTLTNEIIKKHILVQKSRLLMRERVGSRDETKVTEGVSGQGGFQLHHRLSAFQQLTTNKTIATESTKVGYVYGLTTTWTSCRSFAEKQKVAGVSGTAPPPPTPPPPPPPPSQKPPPSPYTATENALIKFKFCFSFTQTGQICNLAAFRTM